MRLARNAVRNIIKGQKEDGYLYANPIAPQHRWTNLQELHELYDVGHLIEAAVAYLEGTGRCELLDAMCRCADLLVANFGRGGGKRRGYPGHPEIELALIKLYRATGRERYLELARFFVDERGRRPHYFDLEKQECRRRNIPMRGWISDYSYLQAHRPLREQTEAVGHAVRATYLYCGAADVAVHTGDTELLRACKRLWKSATRRRMYVTGGIGSTAQGEAFTLPEPPHRAPAGVQAGGPAPRRGAPEVVQLRLLSAEPGPHHRRPRTLHLLPGRGRPVRAPVRRLQRLNATEGMPGAARPGDGLPVAGDGGVHRGTLAAPALHPGPSDAGLVPGPFAAAQRPPASSPSRCPCPSNASRRTRPCGWTAPGWRSSAAPSSTASKRWTTGRTLPTYACPALPSFERFTGRSCWGEPSSYAAGRSGGMPAPGAGTSCTVRPGRAFVSAGFRPSLTAFGATGSPERCSSGSGTLEPHGASEGPGGPRLSRSRRAVSSGPAPHVAAR